MTEFQEAELEVDCADLVELSDMDERAEEDALEHILGLTDDELDAVDVGVELLNRQLEEFLRPGGGWAGTEVPVRRAVILGRRNALTVTSLKRSSGNSGSDHHVSQRAAAAADLSNAPRQTPQMLRTARQIAAAMGYRWPSNGYLQTATTRAGYRAQLIYDSPVVPGHHNHVHFGVRKVR